MVNKNMSSQEFLLEENHEYLQLKKNVELPGQWWCTPLVPALRIQRQVDFYELEASMVKRVNSRNATEKV